MSKSYLYSNVLLLSLFIAFSACQNDKYLEPELNPKNYSFTIPNKISFDFSQQSYKSKSIIPYHNRLNVKNISGATISAEFILVSFNSDKKDYNNISFIERGFVSKLNFNDILTELPLPQTDVLFTDNNVIVSILNFNDVIPDHILNGLYQGELNIYTITNNFSRSVTCVGFIDYQGKFEFYIQDSDEVHVVVLQGNINRDNLISGNILNRDGQSISQISNIINDDLILDEGNLSGKVMFTENSEKRILQFNLTHQN